MLIVTYDKSRECELKMNPSITLIFVCAKCGAGYRATQKPRTEKIKGNFHCEVCQTEIYAWSGPYAYLDWQAVETIPKPSQRHRAERFG